MSKQSNNWYKTWIVPLIYKKLCVSFPCFLSISPLSLGHLPLHAHFCWKVGWELGRDWIGLSLLECCVAHCTGKYWQMSVDTANVSTRMTRPSSHSRTVFLSEEGLRMKAESSVRVGRQGMGVSSSDHMLSKGGDLHIYSNLVSKWQLLLYPLMH